MIVPTKTEAIAHAMPWFAESACVVGAPPEGLRDALAARNLHWTDSGHSDAVIVTTIPDDWTPITNRLSPCGWVLYFSDTLPETTDTPSELRLYPARHPRQRSRYTAIEAHQKSEDPTLGQGVLMVHAAYDPVAHAARLSASGRPEAAFEILDQLPISYLEGPEQRLLIHLEMQMALLASGDRCNMPKEDIRFVWAQQQFYHILNLLPTFPAPYQCQAAFWRRIGDVDMARRILTSTYLITDDEGVARDLKSLPEATPKPARNFVPPAWNPETYRPRILLLNHSNADCGLDNLFEGLCRCLGAEKVVEYPWKHYLHGHPIDDDVRHPSTYAFPGDPKTVEQVEAELCAKHYDLVVLSDTLGLSSYDETRRLLQAAEGISLVLADLQDEGFDNFDSLCQWLKIAPERIAAHFKREMLKSLTYPPGTYPLPLAYSDNRAAPAFLGDRDIDLFWAGHRCWGMRRPYLDYIEQTFDRSFDALCNGQEYARLLDRALIGLEIFGLGYDSVRFHEIPAHGAMLLAEQKPIHYPHIYVDGVSAVFYEDLPDLVAKIHYYRAHQDVALEIAERGFNHFKEHHTTAARARHFLGRVQRCIEQGSSMAHPVD